MTKNKDQAASNATGFLGIPSWKQAASGTGPTLAEPSWVERWVLQKLLSLMGNPHVRFVLWNGEQVPTTCLPDCRRVLIHDRKTLWQLASNPDLHFGDAYSRGALEIEGDLTGFIEDINRARMDANHRNNFV